ncbi:MAG TPA: penicillin-binding protein 2 [Candidatus Acidoferrales bacterium]|nr:penicillin-binding protein 2 [Candidatus Acidoferrales bacterium]
MVGAGSGARGAQPLGVERQLWLGGREPRPRWSRRLSAFAAAALLSLGILGLRLAQLQLGEGTQLRQQAASNSLRHLVLPAERGIIYDRHGRPLVQNSPAWHLRVVPADLPRAPAERDGELHLLARLSSTPEQDLRRLLGAARDPFRPVTVRADLTSAQALAVNERLPELPGVSLQRVAVRTYGDPLVLSHVVGYLGRIDEDEYEQLKAEGYQPDESLGKAGVEAGLEPVLRGRDGWVEVEVDARGQVVRSLREVEPLAGSSVYLSIDAGFQDATAQALAAGLAARGLSAGAAVVVDPRSGELLALVSQPGYDVNLFARGISGADYRRLLEDPARPLLNRAISGQYPPGSTFKMITGAAGLETGAISADSVLGCPPYIRYGDWVYHNWASYSLGAMNVTRALAVSCDTFFYVVADQVGDQTLARYARAFGYGTAPQIEIPGAAPGIAPDRDWKLARCGSSNPRSDQCRWNPGDTITMGIGQSFLLTTPLIQAMYVSALANGGQLLQPTLVHEVRGPGGKVLRRAQKTVVGQVPVSPANLATLREGMRQSINPPYHMNYWFQQAGVPADGGGKTGTAQWGGDGQDTPTHAWFLYFAPFDQPEIAIAIFCEDGSLSEVTAAPIAVRIMRYYLDHRTEIRG